MCYTIGVLVVMSIMNQPDTQPRPRGNPNFKPRWNHPTMVMRLPGTFKEELFCIARLLDDGLITPSDIEKFVVSRRKDAILAEVESAIGADPGD